MQVLGEGSSSGEVVCEFNQLTMKPTRVLRICQVKIRSVLADTRLLDLQIRVEAHDRYFMFNRNVAEQLSC